MQINAKTSIVPEKINEFLKELAHLGLIAFIKLLFFICYWLTKNLISNTLLNLHFTVKK